MRPLYIFLFGRIRVFQDDTLQTEVKLSRMTQMLLAYLLLERHRWQHRESLTHLLWHDPIDTDTARKRLNTALWRLRRGLNDEGEYISTTPSGEVRINWNAHFWLDVLQFEENLHAVLPKAKPPLQPADLNRLETTLELYRGDLLEGVDADWVETERERLRQLYTGGLQCLMRHYFETGNIEVSQNYGHKILEVDPYREDIYLDLMKIYMAKGQKALAIRQYQTCYKILKAELNIEPMEAIKTYYRQLVSGVCDPLPLSNPSLQQIMTQLQQAHDDFEQAQRKLQSATTIFQQYLAQQQNRPGGDTGDGDTSLSPK